MPARVGLEPGDDLGCLVHLQVVEDRMHLLVGRDLGLEQLEEVEELDAAVALVDVALDFARVDEQGGEQSDGAVPLVFELAPGGRARRRRDLEGVRLSVYQGSRSPKWILNESSAALQL